MTPEQFLKELLETQDLNPEQERLLEAHKTEVTDFLRVEFGDAPVIKYAGSREKGTMICDKYDLDIVCYFPSSDTRTLREIREDVSARLSEKYLIEPKASAVRIKNLNDASTPNDYHIDVVPGRFIEGTKDVFLHVAYGDKERMQTNLKTHIDHIVNSGCVPVIRLAKLWACRNDLAIKTFVLELFVVQSLSGSRNKDKLKESFLEVLRSFKDEFTTTQLVDPANTNNVVSRLVSSSEKFSVAQAAEAALNRIAESDAIADWKAVFREEGDQGKYFPASPSTGPAIIHSPADRGFVPRSPWCCDYADRSR